MHILFVLTTNRPKQLEGALPTDLAGRSGDCTPRRMILAGELIQLYGRVCTSTSPDRPGVIWTRGVSAAFIKELMRRTAQAVSAGMAAR